MPRYEFQPPTGKIVEMFYNMDDAPSIGTTVEVGGITFTRVAEKVQVSAQQDLHFVSRSLCRNDPDAPRVNEQGQPCFQSQKEVREFTAKKEGDWVWD